MDHGQEADSTEYQREPDDLRAGLSDNVRLSAEWEHLARCYVRLAQQAEHNQTLDIAYETPARHDGDRSEPPPDKS